VESYPASRVLCVAEPARGAFDLFDKSVVALGTGVGGRIESLVVDHYARCHGVGSALLTAAEALAASWQCLAIEVSSSRRRTDAHAFYQRYDYRDICERSARFWKQLN
jgi:GNAT superfamily N-acetyltransferase